ncbi:MAG: methyltransferase domain-containing protein [Bacteroidales bacterium]
MDTKAIEIRYSELSLDDGCCLSCGNALGFARAARGEVCADLGSGQGSDVLRMAEEVGPGGFAYGIDVSDGMLRKARKRAEKMGVRNVSFIKSQLERIDLDSERVDLVISNCTINHAADKKAVWSEIHRILKKGGRFVVSDIYATAEVPERYRTDPQAVAECWAGSVTRKSTWKPWQPPGSSTLKSSRKAIPIPRAKWRW